MDFRYAGVKVSGTDLRPIVPVG
ncbi:MAG: hypothetical protein QOG76_8363, partial [Pseudonocardiales bacterium]|nr:hypothetical protein [Pseudonocardiales bacterium]